MVGSEEVLIGGLIVITLIFFACIGALGFKKGSNKALNLILVFSVIAVMLAGTEYYGQKEVKEKNSAAFWQDFNKDYEEQEALIKSQQQAEKNKAKEAAEKDTTKKAVVNASSLNVRKGPSKNQPVIRSIKKGTEVTILKWAGDWVQIKYGNNQTGYVYVDYLTIK